MIFNDNNQNNIGNNLIKVSKSLIKTLLIYVIPIKNETMLSALLIWMEFE